MNRRRLLGASVAALALPSFARANPQGSLFVQWVRETLRDDSVRTLVVNPLTFELADDSLWTNAAQVRAAMPQLLESTAVDLLSSGKRSEAVRLPPAEIPSEIKVIYPTDAMLKSIFADKSLARAWDRFYEAFPGSSGLLSFSAAGFSRDSSQAAFVVKSECGGKCGGGQLVLMSKSGATWRIQERLLLWVS